MTWAIKNSKTSKWLYGTNYGHGNTYEQALNEWNLRRL